MARRFDKLTFQVPNVNACKAFYQDTLGMSSFNGGDLLGFDANGLKLRFQKCASRRQSTSWDKYWKIGITVKNLDHAVAFLRQKGVEVSQPLQFLDVGYLCHLRDPVSGLGIELLQQGFEGDEDEAIPEQQKQNQSHPIGCQAILAHITIRSSNSEFAGLQNWCQDTMGMRLISVQPVTPYGFTLYFYTLSDDDDQLPSNKHDPMSVENRPWLWARPYALLEIQHRTGSKQSEQELRPANKDEAGPISLSVLKLSGGGAGEYQDIDCRRDLGL